METDDRSKEVPLRTLFFVGLLSAPALLAGSSAASFPFLYGSVIALCLGAALLLGGFLVARRHLSLPSTLTWVALPLALAAIGSALVASAGIEGWWGSGFENGTAGSLIMLALFVAAGSMIPRQLALVPVYLLCFSMLVCAVVAPLVFLFAPAFFSSVFASAAWTAFPYLFIAALIFLVILRDASGTKSAALFIPVSIVLTLAALLLFPSSGEALAAVVLLTGAAWIRFSTKRFPVASLILAAVFAIATFVSTTALFESTLEPVVNPGTEAVVMSTASLYDDSFSHALLGAGPQSFLTVWDRYRPVSFNATPVWDYAFRSSGNGGFILLVMFGVVGLLSFCIIPLAILRTLWREPSERKPEVVAVFAAAVFVGAAYLIFTDSLSLLLLFGLLSGSLLALIRTPSSVSARVPRIVVGWVCGALGLILVSISFLQFRAADIYTAALSEGDSALRIARMEEASEQWGSSLYIRGMAEAVLSDLKETDAPETAAAIRDRIDTATYTAGWLSNSDDSARADFTIASIYLELAREGKTGAQDIARDVIERAALIAPTHPEVLYFLAVIAMFQDDRAQARVELTKALSLKSDYVPALELLKRIQ